MPLSPSKQPVKKITPGSSLKKKIEAAKRPVTKLSDAASKKSEKRYAADDFVSPILPTLKDEKASSYIGGIVVNVRKRLGKRADISPTLLSDGDVSSDVTEWISTGFAELDEVLGGGWAVGRSSEIFGVEASGKSAVVHAAIRAVQQMGGFAMLHDFERALDMKKMRQLGIDPTRVVYKVPRYIEEGHDIWKAYLDRFEANYPPAPILVALDSIAAAPPAGEVNEESSEQAHVGLQARAMGRLFRAFNGRLGLCRVHMMFINQVRDAISIGGPVRGYMPPVTPGGRAAKFFASQRVRFAKIKTFKVGDRSTGYLIEASTVKSRLTVPHQKARWVLDFKYGPSPELSALQTLLDARIVKTQGGRYTAPFMPLAVSRDVWVKTLREDKGIRKAAMDQAAKVVRQMQDIGAVDEDDEPTEDEDGGED